MCVCLLFAAPLSKGARASGCPGAGLRPTAANARTVEAATLCLIRRIRAAYRLHALHANAALRHVAISQVAAMVRANYFADRSPTGQTPMSLVGGTRYPAHAADIAIGENLAWGSDAYSTPAQIVAAWMASPPHREIMLNGEFHDAGVAVTPFLPRVLHAGHSGAIYAVEFGVRR